MIYPLLDAGMNNFRLLHDYSFGGYAKHNPDLINFMNGFYRKTGIPSDFVYTGKLFFAVTDLVQKDYFPPGSRVLVIHSGGLQGNRSLPEASLLF
jgi:1-aminocyclopropane-1-carboxylate deaminase/D-cysteine desulfhydrase-like pyridoxal-dependent ACC family enzyme